MADLGPLTATKLFGGAVSGGGAVKQAREDKRNRQRIEQITQFLGTLKTPLAEQLEQGLIPGGEFRDLLAAEGQQAATTQAVQSGVQARQVGSRTSALARRLEGQKDRFEGAGFIGAERQAATTADFALASQMLERLGLSSLLDLGPSRAGEGFRLAGAAIQGAGQGAFGGEGLPERGGEIGEDDDLVSA